MESSSTWWIAENALLNFIYYPKQHGILWVLSTNNHGLIHNIIYVIKIECSGVRTQFTQAERKG